MSNAGLMSWFALGLLAGSAVATLVPGAGLPLAFLVAMFGLLAALLAHALAEDRNDRGTLVRVAAAYMMASAAAVVVGMWWMTILLAAGAVATVIQVQRVSQPQAWPAFS